MVYLLVMLLVVWGDGMLRELVIGLWRWVELGVGQWVVLWVVVERGYLLVLILGGVRLLLLGI
jgi:hypothetical protein